jgi:hypothetical protein
MKSPKKTPYIQRNQSGLKKPVKVNKLINLAHGVLRGLATRAATSAIPYTELTVADGNFDTSRVTIDRVIIHTMVGTWQSAANRFGAYGTQVSAHYGVGYDGSLYHWLEEYWTAYHAGNYAMNQRSIGIEHEDMGNYNSPRPDTLYATSAKLVYDICKYYGIPIDRSHILKHSEVIATGCPDSLDIDRIVRQAQALAQPSLTPQQKLDKIAALCVGTGQIYKYKIRQVLQS